MFKKAKLILESHHPLGQCMKRLPSGKRLQSTFCRTERYKLSSVPSAIRIFNNMISNYSEFVIYCCL